ncbi:MAG: M48 family metalloprotease [Pseudomonadota bacterium]
MAVISKVRLTVCVAGSLFLASCSHLSVFDLTDNARSTINGETIKTAVNPPPPVRTRSSDALFKAAEQENLRIIAAYGGVYKNRSVENQVAKIVSNLVSNSTAPSQGFQITILNSPSVNAFALPGGFLYITRGLLALASDESEVAAVLAHEMAHVTAEHGQQRLQRARNSELVAEAVRGVFGNQETADFVLAKRQLDFAAFSQAQEFEADQIGVATAGRAGYDPFAASRFLKIMARFQDYRSNQPVARGNQGRDFLSSHPTTPVRIEKARLAARTFGAPGVGQTNRFEYLKAIDGMIFGDDPKEGFVRDRSFFHPKLRFTFTVPRGYVIDNTAEAVLATASNEDAVRFDGVAVPDGMSLEDYLASGWLNGLNSASVKTFTINGAEAASATARVAEWHFKITVIRAQDSIYRMIFATKQPSVRFDRAVSATVASFRSLSKSEADALSPLRVRIKRVEPGETVVTLSRSMKGLVANPEEAFRALNGLSRQDRLRTGDYIKVVVDEVVL